MAGVRRGAVLEQIDRLYREGTLAGLGDAELLERYLTHRDEAAFETLVNVHGPMVLGLCRRMLREPKDVEDAFQATFLVLVRKAPAIRDRELLANWLYGVAYRIASRARSDVMRRRGREIAVANLEAPVNAEATDIAEIAPVLDRELNRLPRNYRTALVCCYLGGQTHEQTAKALGCPVGTVRSRIARGRDMLRKRLTRLGYAPSAAFLGPAGGLPTKLLTEAVPPALVSMTVNAGLAIGSCKTIQAGAVGATVLALTQGALTTMKLAQLKWIGLAVLATTCSAGGVIAVSYASGQAGQGQTAAAGSGQGGRRRPAARQARSSGSRRDSADPPTADKPSRTDGPKPEPGNPSTARTLRLPDTPYRYADIDLPAHFKTRCAAVRQHAGRQPGHRSRGDARPGALLRHPAVGQQHGRLRFLPSAEKRLRRSEPLQQGIRGQADRPPRHEPGQPALRPARPILLGRAGRRAWKNRCSCRSRAKSEWARI